MNTAGSFPGRLGMRGEGEAVTEILDPHVVLPGSLSYPSLARLRLRPTRLVVDLRERGRLARGGPQHAHDCPCGRDAARFQRRLAQNLAQL